MVRFTFLKLQFYIYLLIVSPEPILRKEFGTVFTPATVVNTATSSFHQTFIISLNQEELPVQKLQFCSDLHNRSFANDRFANNAETYCPALNSYHARVEILQTDIDRYHQIIDKLLPRSRTIRNRRGLFDAVGEASKFLFGTSTSKDQAKLRKLIQTHNAFEAGHINQIRDNIDDLSTSVKIVTSRQSTLASSHKTFSTEVCKTNPRSSGFFKARIICG